MNSVQYLLERKITVNICGYLISHILQVYDSTNGVTQNENVGRFVRKNIIYTQLQRGEDEKGGGRRNVENIPGMPQLPLSKTYSDVNVN